MTEHSRTEVDPHGPAGSQTRVKVEALRLTVLSGPDSGQVVTTEGGAWSIGSHANNDTVLNDPKVSRFHFELRLEENKAWLRDLGSLNGTLVDGVLAVEVGLRSGSTIRVGDTELRCDFMGTSSRVRLSSAHAFGSLVGRSVRMRECFAHLERAALSESTILIEGESGTGKEEAARSLHLASSRSNGPFVTIDGGALSGSLVSSELFGHVRGAFTGAEKDRTGAFELANGGTLFLDEVGELDADLQKSLLRVLEDRTIQPIGSNDRRPVDVRIVAATCRQLRELVNKGEFRSDLYYRLAVVRVVMPSLRERPDDLAIIVDHLARELGAPEEVLEELINDSHIATLRRAAWPGNVRQLRNHLEVAIAMQSVELGLVEDLGSEDVANAKMPFRLAKRLANDSFEQRYLTEALRQHSGSVSSAAKAAGVHRGYFYELLRKHNISPS